MNARQRHANRRNAALLRSIATAQRFKDHVCENCGEHGAHWWQTRGTSLAALIAGIDDQEGFWSCDNKVVE